MVDSMAPCRSCGTEVPTASTECPACGYEVSAHNRRRLYLGAVGTVLTMTVILAPIGVPVLLAATRHREIAEWGVTQPDGSSRWAHLRAVLRHQFSLKQKIDPRKEFTRGGAGDRERIGRPPTL